MKFKTLSGKTRTISNAKKYRIDWTGSSKSKIQKRVKVYLENYWKNHIVFEEFPVAGTRLSLDFYNANKKVAIEVQGKQHGEFNKFFHDNSRLKYLEGIKRDIKKAEWLEKNGFILFEIEEDEVDSLSLEFFLEKFGMSI